MCTVSHINLIKELSNGPQMGEYRLRLVWYCNPEIFTRILISQIALKDILSTKKFCN